MLLIHFHSSEIAVEIKSDPSWPSARRIPHSEVTFSDQNVRFLDPFHTPKRNGYQSNKICTFSPTKNTTDLPRLNSQGLMLSHAHFGGFRGSVHRLSMDRVPSGPKSIPTDPRVDSIPIRVDRTGEISPRYPRYV